MFLFLFYCFLCNHRAFQTNPNSIILTALNLIFSFFYIQLISCFVAFLFFFFSLLGVEDGQKVFVVTGHYPDIVEDMKDRGWFHNEDRESAFYDLKWTIQSNHIKHKTLNNKQIVNHFGKASTIGK